FMTVTDTSSSLSLRFSFFFTRYGPHRTLPSFPTRRSSDLSGTEIIFKPLPQDDPTRRRPDITKAKELLGWEPKINSFAFVMTGRSEEHTSELQSPYDLVCRLLLEKKKTNRVKHCMTTISIS